MNEKPVKKITASYTVESGSIYDIIYSYKDYESEASKIASSLKRRIASGGNSLLEAACGTGSYLQYLKDDFDVTGFDLSKGQIEYARKKLPDTKLFVADMTDFDTGEQYDAIVCLFSSIGYLKTVDKLNNTMRNFAHHTKAGGVVIVEPWLMAEKFKSGHVSTESSNDGTTYVMRMGTSSREGNISKMQMHIIVGRGENAEHYVEHHDLAMYTREELAYAFENAGFDLEIDPEGLTGRGLYIGTKR